MGLYAGDGIWANNIYQFEQTDPVQGGPDGIDNRPLQELADRTVWLRNSIGRINRFYGQATISTNSTITPDQAGYFITVQSGGVLTVTLASVSSFNHGDIIPITAYCLTNAVVNITPQPGQPIADPVNGNSSVIYMHNREHIMLIALTSYWAILSADGNFYTAGEEVKGRRARGNTLPLQGQLLQRSQYPRLWQFVSSLPSNQEVITESLYFADSVTYRGFFTTGDGSTTFRLPDERGLFERMLDGGRGLDTSRTRNYGGGYEADELKTHNHTTDSFSRRGWPKDSGDRTNNYYFIDKSRDTSFLGTLSINNTGGNETRPKNIGKLNLIKF